MGSRKDPQMFKRWVWVLLLHLALLRGDPAPEAIDAIDVQTPPTGRATCGTESRNLLPDGPLPEWLQTMTEDIASEHQLSPKLIESIILTESRGDPRRVSPKGAKGLMQLMPVVVRHYRVSDPYDPVSNIRAGVQYLRSLLEVFSGDLPLALAAYNAGPTAVRKYKGIPPFPETQAFVLKVTELFHATETARPLLLSLPKTVSGKAQEKPPTKVSPHGRSPGLAMLKNGIQG